MLSVAIPSLCPHTTLYSITVAHGSGCAIFNRHRQTIPFRYCHLPCKTQYKLNKCWYVWSSMISFKTVSSWTARNFHDAKMWTNDWRNKNRERESEGKTEEEKNYRGAEGKTKNVTKRNRIYKRGVYSVRFEHLNARRNKQYKMHKS